MLPPLLLDVGGHQLEAAETILQLGRFLVIVLAARAMAELMVRLQLPTILGELVAGVLIGVSGLHLIPPPEAHAELNGQMVIGAAVLDDILGIVILAVVVSLAGGGSLELAPILKLVAAAVVFVLAAIGLSRTAAPGFDWLIDRLKAPGDVVVASFVVLTLCCFAATAIGLEAALGAFAAGLILSKSNHSHAIEAAVKPVVALFATIFFVLIGTGMDLTVLNPFDPANRAGLVVAGFLLLVAIAGKVAAGWCFLSRQPTDRLVVGLGMMPRGEVGLIFLGLGTQAHLLSPALEAAILLMVIGTTFLAPILLRLVLAGRTNGPDLDPLAEIPT